MTGSANQRIRLSIDAMPVAPGGGLTVLLGYLEGWRQIDAPLDITVYTWRTTVVEALKEAGFEKLLSPAPVTSRRAALIWERRQLPRAINAAGADVVWTSNLMLSGVAAPQVVHHQTLFSLEHDRLSAYFRGGARRVLQFIGARKALKRAARNVFISNYLRERADSIVPSSSDRNQVIYNGVAQAWLDRAKRGRSHSNLSRTICTLSAPSPHKDNESVLQVMAELARLQPDAGWRLIIAGPSDWSAWKTRAVELGIGDLVDFVGYLNIGEVAQLYEKSICTIFPSLFEAFGLPIVEAMACGCPVIAVDRTAMPEVAGDAAAALVEPADVGEMVAAVLRLASDESWFRAKVTASYERALAFSWPKSAEALLDVFWDVVAEHSRVD